MRKYKLPNNINHLFFAAIETTFLWDLEGGG
jgi:hypothetical protein